MQHIVIIGAGSAIARAVARRYAAQHDALFLVARDGDALAQQSEDLQLRGASRVDYSVLDVTDTGRHRQCFDEIWGKMGHVDLVLICHGTLPEQSRCEHDFARIRQVFETNALSTIALLSELSPRLIEQGRGCLAVITSVAGDRGRASNYVYGASKATVSCYLEGLRAALFHRGVHVIDVRPGFVDTPMTSDFDKGPLWVQPEKLARVIERGIARRRNILYAPWYWRWIMLIIRLIPEPIFKRIRL